MSALERLQAWIKKGRRLIITSGPHVMPGDGVMVTLSEGERSVQVDEFDLQKYDYATDKLVDDSSLENAVNKALDLWEGKE